MAQSNPPAQAGVAFVRRLGILIRARLAGELSQAALKRLVRGVYFAERRMPL